MPRPVVPDSPSMKTVVMGRDAPCRTGKVAARRRKSKRGVMQGPRIAGRGDVSSPGEALLRGPLTACLQAGSRANSGVVDGAAAHRLASRP